MNRSRLSLALSLLLVFASGVAVGVFGRSYYQSTAVAANTERPRSSDDYRKMYVEEMSKRLTLNLNQQAKLNEILDDTRTKYRAVRERHKPETKAIQDQQVERVNAMLTELQRLEYTKMRAEREAKRIAEEKGRESKPAPPSK